jgi:hypothetical protein
MVHRLGSLNTPVTNLLIFDFGRIRMSFRPSAWNNSAPTGWIFVKCNIWYFSTSLEKIQVSLNLTTITVTVHADQYTLFITPGSALLRTINVSDKRCTENQNTFWVQYFLFFENRALCEIEWKSNVGWGRTQMNVRRMRFACWILKATNTHSEYEILNAFPLQKWLPESPQCYVINTLFLLSLANNQSWTQTHDFFHMEFAISTVAESLPNTSVSPTYCLLPFPILCHRTLGK